MESINWGGDGPILHIAHANSYHPGIYKELITLLKPHFEVHSILTRPFRKEHNYEDFNSWNQFRDDFLELAYKKNWKNIIGAGHSLGSTITMMAAIKQPEIFSKLIIIEPPCIDWFLYPLIDIIPYSIGKSLIPPSKIALKRRHKWSSKEEAFDHFRKKSIYNRVSDAGLRAFIDHGLAEDENGEYRLTHSKHWESKIYCTIENPYRLFPKLSQPSLCIRAAESDVIRDRNWDQWQKVHKNAKFVNIKAGGHLVPIEKPLELAKEIISFSS